MKNDTINQIFISHINEESELAIVLKEWIESTFPGKISVFVSSDESDITAGDKWFEKIDEFLNISNIFLVICSASSIKRPWINFEAGAGWIKKVPLIPLCHSGVTPSGLPSPYEKFQALDLESNDFANKFIKALGTHIGELTIPRLDYKQFKEDLSQAIKRSSKSSKDMINQKNSNKDRSQLLDDEQSKILKIIERLGSQVTVDQMAKGLNISDTKVQYTLDTLSELEYMGEGTDWRGGVYYYCTTLGRKYLIENNIVE